MSREVEFLIYCLEIYKSDKGLTGKEVIDLFCRYGVTDYLTTYFEALHITGEKYIIGDIDMFIKNRQE